MVKEATAVHDWMEGLGYRLFLEQEGKTNGWYKPLRGVWVYKMSVQDAFLRYRAKNEVIPF